MKLLRKMVLKLLKATAFDTTIKHHHTNGKFFLNSYSHKGYWYHGANRESNTVKIFNSWIKPGDFVLEIGGHIGYFTTFYAAKVGKNGKVDVFEPSDKNAKYLHRNINFLPADLKNIVTVVDKGAGDVNKVMDFYIDPISGQNNSFVEDFEGFFSSRENSAVKYVEPIKESVNVITLDSYFENVQRLPDFVKIDVEGFEWNVIQGFVRTIDNAHPSLMIEIQADSDKLIPFFKERNYTIYNDRLEEVIGLQDYATKKTPNMFFRFNQ